MSLDSDDVTGLMATFPELLHDLTEDSELACHPEVAERCKKILGYSLVPSHMLFFLMHLTAYKAFASPEQLTKENLRKAHILAWCSELAFVSVIITDDMMDGCAMRFGKPCWFRNKGVGMTAINDALMVENAVFVLIRRHFRDHPVYASVIEHWHKVFLNLSIGQCLDLQCIQDEKPQLDLFTRARCDLVTKYKTGFGFHTPIALALLLAGIEDHETHSQVESIVMDIAEWYQAQDDFLDYAATPETLGRDIGNDIKTGKCTWLAVTALECASPDQRVIMERYYGSEDPEHIQVIRELYTELNIPHLFSVYEKDFFDGIHAKIDKHFSGRPQTFFKELIQKWDRLKGIRLSNGIT